MGQPKREVRAPPHKASEPKLGGNSDAFDALLRRAVPDEADQPESGTSDREPA